MAIDYQALKAELLAGHPVTGPYDADNQIAANQLNAVNREGPPDPLSLLQYITLERFRTGTLYGRLKMLSDVRKVRAGNSYEFVPVPLGAGDADIVPSQEQVAAASALMRYVDTDTEVALSLLDSRIDNILNDLGPSGAGAISAVDKTAIQGFSQNRQSRVQELNIGFVRVGDVEFARSLP
jgi:hypothetical protein